MIFQIYGRENCVHCKRAVDFLEEHWIDYSYTDMTNWPKEKLKLIVNHTGMKTVPMIFEVVEGELKLIGGADDLINYVKEYNE